MRPIAAAWFIAAAAPASAEAPFEPVQFFIGKTHGDGTLRELLKAPKTVSVDSVGSVAADGTLVLRQRVLVQGDPPRDRVWRLKKIGANGYSGTLNDARGPVTATAQGNSVHIRYRTTDGLSVQQWLTPIAASEGKAIANRMTFSKLGFVVARLTERIEKR